LLVATRVELVIGMGQWTLIYDMFWSAYGGNVEWLYVRPEHRRSGVAAAIVAEISAQGRDAGGEFLHGGGNRDAEALYERVAMGWKAHEPNDATVIAFMRGHADALGLRGGIA
jgi:GNAT superfamily N-acetyltransferase